MTPQERVSEWVRRLFVVLSVGCAVYALATITWGDARSALTVAAAGLAFYLLAHQPFDDLDDA